MLNFLSTSTQKDTRKRRYLLLCGWVIPHQLLHTANTTGTLNILAIAKYNCRVYSLTFRSQANGRAVKWVCGHSLAGTEGSNPPGAIMFFLWVWVCQVEVSAKNLPSSGRVLPNVLCRSVEDVRLRKNNGIRQNDIRLMTFWLSQVDTATKLVHLI